MGVSVTFDYASWSARYPEFSTTVTSAIQAQLYFDEATIWHANDGSGPVTDSTRQLALLNMLTAHVAQLAVGSSQQPASPLVGRVSSASEGSVSVQAEDADASSPGSQAWFKQTKYGNSYWSATAQYRQAQYRPGRRRNFSPWFGYR